MAEPQIERVGIAAGYGESVVLDNVSLTIADEGSLSILGPPSGVGKSNPLLTIMGFTSVSEGKVPWRGAGRDITAWSGVAADLKMDQARLDRYIGLNLAGA